MPYYPIGDLASTGPKDSGGGYETDLLTLGGEDGSILPLFTSMNRFWGFVDVYLGGDGSLQPSTFPIDPFQLAEKIEPLGEIGELGFLVRAVPPLVLRDPSMRYPTFHEVSIKPASAARARPTV